jgi:hypothetical protein
VQALLGLSFEPFVLDKDIDETDDPGLIPNDSFRFSLATDNKSAIVSWDLTSTGFELVAVVVKDGRADNDIFWQVYGVDASQALVSSNWNNLSIDIATHTVDTPTGGGAISHISAYGVVGNTVVPEPATIALLGIGLAGLAGVGARRKWKKNAVDKS